MRNLENKQVCKHVYCGACNLSIYLFIYLSIHLFIYMFTCLSINIYLSVDISIYLSSYLFIYLSIHLFTYLFFYLYICLSYLSICLYIFIYPSICQSVCLSARTRSLWYRFDIQIPKQEVKTFYLSMFRNTFIVFHECHDNGWEREKDWERRDL